MRAWPSSPKLARQPWEDLEANYGWLQQWKTGIQHWRQDNTTVYRYGEQNYAQGRQPKIMLPSHQQDWWIAEKKSILQSKQIAVDILRQCFSASYKSIDLYSTMKLYVFPAFSITIYNQYKGLNFLQFHILGFILFYYCILLGKIKGTTCVLYA